MALSVLMRSASAAFVSALVAFPAAAHFQQILPASDVLPEGGPATVDLVFTHPFEGGPIMDMKRPAAVGVLTHGEKIDLSGQLAENPQGDAMTWRMTHELAEPGAAIFYVTPQPYWEPSENIYIVHHAKVIVDSFASGDGWDEMIGLPAEIQPLTQPTAIWTGNLFSGVVTQAGKPVPFAEIEVAYVNEDDVQAPNDAYITPVIKADANGTFHYAIPHAGWWGFAALLEGSQPMTSPDGQEVAVEEGALIWVHAKDMAQ